MFTPRLFNERHGTTIVPYVKYARYQNQKLAIQNLIIFPSNSRATSRPIYPRKNALLVRYAGRRESFLTRQNTNSRLRHRSSSGVGRSSNNRGIRRRNNSKLPISKWKKTLISSAGFPSILKRA
ncbi:uncharacterized protein BDCG_16588 [Blastomyces dermatitidis ER-3]|uniref:Uncharacterized protein n=1 Tax=Ajellomyces dermatitidis (strain ER-3 / ATCC MYA-2586) TaxID=559297 RepID=A0ABX2VT03_AJEDR|nr:uncharacterized protein BDCG_16588 [Blastomyces dermatitidis ER-3]OAT00334.1 hypothetical protein BDCG_16588 [Blastomyces dermatitidis ER-3]